MHEPVKSEPEDEGEGESNRLFVIALVFVVVLGISGFFVVRSLIDMVRLQNCAMTGRRNC